jgi:hypothetical protein
MNVSEDIHEHLAGVFLNLRNYATIAVSQISKLIEKLTRITAARRCAIGVKVRDHIVYPRHDHSSVVIGTFNTDNHVDHQVCVWR